MHIPNRAKVVDKGLFSSGSVVFRIDTPSKGWSVERKYKEFCELRRELDRLYPGNIAPPIYGPKNEKETNPKVMSGLRHVLQQFLDDILSHPLLNCSELIYYFLFIPVQNGKKVDEFGKRIKLYALAPAPKEIEEIKTYDGTAIIALTPEVNSRIDSLSASVGKLSVLYNT